MHPNHHASAGFVVRDATGHRILAMVKKLGTMEILVAEALGLRDGLLAIPNPASLHLSVEGDPKILIDAINGKIATLWKIKFLVLDIIFLSYRFASIGFNHIFREANFVADSFALLGHSASPSLEWFNSLMSYLCLLVPPSSLIFLRAVVLESSLCSYSFLSYQKEKKNDDMLLPHKLYNKQYL